MFRQTSHFSIMHVTKLLTTIFITIVFITFGCTTDTKTIEADQLYGYWEIRSAQRNGHPTETLTNTFFEFTPTNRMRTNFNMEGIEVSSEFQINGNDIIQKQEDDLQYAVEKLEDNKLVLFVTLMDYNFTLNLEKTN